MKAKAVFEAIKANFKRPEWLDHPRLMAVLNISVVIFLIAMTWHQKLPLDHLQVIALAWISFMAGWNITNAYALRHAERSYEAVLTILAALSQCPKCNMRKVMVVAEQAMPDDNSDDDSHKHNLN